MEQVNSLQLISSLTTLVNIGFLTITMLVLERYHTESTAKTQHIWRVRAFITLNTAALLMIALSLIPSPITLAIVFSSLWTAERALAWRRDQRKRSQNLQDPPANSRK